MKPFINDQRRISGTRISVYDVYHYLISGTSHELIRHYNQIGEVELQVALEYIEANREAVHHQHLIFEDRNARGNSPEVLAKIEAGRESLEQWKATIRSRSKLKECSTHASGHPGGLQSDGPLASHVSPLLAEPSME